MQLQNTLAETMASSSDVAHSRIGVVARGSHTALALLANTAVSRSLSASSWRSICKHTYDCGVTSYDRVPPGAHVFCRLLQSESLSLLASWQRRLMMFIMIWRQYKSVLATHPARDGRAVRHAHRRTYRSLATMALQFA